MKSLVYSWHISTWIFLLDKWEKMHNKYPTNASHYFGSWKSNSSFQMRIHQVHIFSTKNRCFFPTPFQFNIYEVKLSSNKKFQCMHNNTKKQIQTWQVKIANLLNLKTKATVFFFFGKKTEATVLKQLSMYLNVSLELEALNHLKHGLSFTLQFSSF